MEWSGTIPIYINNYNRLTSTRALASWFHDVPGTEVIIVDNGSSYSPLLDWYANECPYKVIRLKDNCGHHAPWSRAAVLCGHTHEAMFGSHWYVVTDPDLSLEGCPKDLLEVCLEGFQLLPEAVKVGLSLEIDDIPPYMRDRVRSWELQYWSDPLNERFYRAPIDTTFALYSTGRTHIASMQIEPALRTNRPYTARHLPWYLDPSMLSDEEAYYYATCNGSNTWKPQ